MNYTVEITRPVNTEETEYANNIVEVKYIPDDDRLSSPTVTIDVMAVKDEEALIEHINGFLPIEQWKYELYRETTSNAIDNVIGKKIIKSVTI